MNYKFKYLLVILIIILIGLGVYSFVKKDPKQEPLNLGGEIESDQLAVTGPGQGLPQTGDEEGPKKYTLIENPILLNDSASSCFLKVRDTDLEYFIYAMNDIRARVLIEGLGIPEDDQEEHEKAKFLWHSYISEALITLSKVYACELSASPTVAMAVNLQNYAGLQGNSSDPYRRQIEAFLSDFIKTGQVPESLPKVDGVIGTLKETKYECTGDELILAKNVFCELFSEAQKEFIEKHK